MRLSKSFAIALVAVATLAFQVSGLQAQEVTLRLHQFLPPMSTLPSKVFKPWAKEIEASSDGRIKIEHYDAMALGGRPSDLYDQARDGVVDIIMVLTGYTPGRFRNSAVFELPFMMTDAVATSKAFWDYIDTDLQDKEYRDVKILGAWVHGPGALHTSKPVRHLEDVKGMKVRGPTRIITDLLTEAGAVAIGMPLPSIPEAVSKGVIEGAVVPWQVVPAIKLSELVNNHTEFSGSEALYTATFIMAMNKDRYESLPEDLKAILDQYSGINLAERASVALLADDNPARELAREAGNTIITLDAEEVARWKEMSRPVVTRWIDGMAAMGVDGQAEIDKVKALIAKHTN